MNNLNQTIQSISDEKIIEFILRHSSQDEYDQMHQQIKENNDLAHRVKQWDELLFSLNDDTLPVTPSNTTWKKIATIINTKSHNKTESFQDKGTNFIAQLLANLSKNIIKTSAQATVLAATLWFGITTIIAPSHSANVYNEDGIVIWKTDTNKDNITFKSISNVSLKNKMCIAWIDSETNGWVKLGKVPDTGKNKLKTIKTPNNYTPQTGDKIHIAMVDSRFSSELMPRTSMSLSVATLK